jgi:hypothetical protein
LCHIRKSQLVCGDLVDIVHKIHSSEGGPSWRLGIER